MRAIHGLAIVAAALLAGAAGGATATFDTFPEGILGTSFTDGGITFFDFDRRLPGDPNLFVVEQADGTLSGPGFSPPNTLGFGGWAPGPSAAFSRCGSFRFTTGTVQDFASLEIFEFFSDAGNVITLEAYLGSTLVNSDSITLPGGASIHHWTLSVSGEDFDSLRLISTGPGNDGVFFGLVDNVVVTPEPATWTLLSLACVALAGRRR